MTQLSQSISRTPQNAALRACVEKLFVYESESTHGSEVVLPSGRMQLLMRIDRDTLRVTPFFSGPRLMPKVIERSAKRWMVGALFRAGGAAPFLPMPCDELCDRTADAEAVWGPVHTDPQRQSAAVLDACPADPLAQLAAFEAALLSRMAGPPNAQLHLSLRAIEAGASVAATIERSGASRSRFVRTFRAAVGTTPKRYASVTRFQKAVRALHAGEENYVDLAYRLGYADQAHFCNAFKRHAGRTPSAYQTSDRAEPNHVRI